MSNSIRGSGSGILMLMGLALLSLISTLSVRTQQLFGRRSLPNGNPPTDKSLNYIAPCCIAFTLGLWLGSLLVMLSQVTPVVWR